MGLNVQIGVISRINAREIPKASTKIVKVPAGTYTKANGAGAERTMKYTSQHTPAFICTSDSFVLLNSAGFILDRQQQ